MKININKNKFCKYIFILSFFIIILNFISIRSDKAFDIIGFRTYTVLSGSMKPKIKPGDVVVVSNKNKEKLKKNDIITFKEDEDVITHRIVDIKNNEYITKGDNNNFIDHFVVPSENVIGKVLFHIPKIGYAIEFLSRPLIAALGMVVLAILIIKENKD